MMEFILGISLVGGLATANLFSKRNYCSTFKLLNCYKVQLFTKGTHE